MIKNLFILAIIITATLSWTYLSNTQNPKQHASEKKVPDFIFKDLNNNIHTLYDYKGKTIILHFWASWCAPCVEELPELINFAAKNDQNLSVIAIAVKDDPADIQQFLSKMKKRTADNFIIGLDPTKSISKSAYNTLKLPETYIITSNLTLLEKIIGAKSNWDNYLLKPLP